MKKINFLLITITITFLSVSCRDNVTPTVSTPSPTFTPSLTQTPVPTSTHTPIPTKTPIPYVYITLGELYNVSALISANDAYNDLWYPNCNDPYHGHVDLSPSHLGTGDLTVKAPVSGTISIFDPKGDGRWEAANITLPPKTLLNGIEDAFSFAGYEFSPKNVLRINVGLGHILYDIPFDYNSSTSDGEVIQGQAIGQMSYEPMSKIGWITGYKVQIFYNLDGKQVEFSFTPDLFEHEPWECNPNSPYDCVPEQKDYAPTCVFP